MGQNYHLKGPFGDLDPRETAGHVIGPKKFIKLLVHWCGDTDSRL